MSNMRLIAWLCFILLAATLKYLSWDFQHFNPGIPNDFAFETAGKDKTREIVETWDKSSWGQHSVTTGVKLFTFIDFAYILAYSYILVTLSYDRMQLERHTFLNNLLRFCFPLAILAGLFDVVENILFLFNMEHYDLAGGYISISPFTYTKWTLIAIVALIWLVSKIKSLIIR
jgi:hypothetical protein